MPKAPRNHATGRVPLLAPARARNERAPAVLVVVAQLLTHAVEVDLERRPDPGRKLHARWLIQRPSLEVAVLLAARPRRRVACATWPPRSYRSGAPPRPARPGDRRRGHRRRGRPAAPRARSARRRRAMRELGPWIERRLAEIERGRAELGRTGRRAVSGERLRSWPSPGARACSAATRLARSRLRVRGRRSSAGTGAARARRSPPGWTGVRRGGHALRGRCRSAASARAGRLLPHGRDELQLAPAARARAGPRLRVWHEVCHLDARPLAALLGAARAPRPDYRTQRWLRRHGPTLVL